MSISILSASTGPRCPGTGAPAHRRAISLTALLLISAAAMAPAGRVSAASWSVVPTPNASSSRNVLTGVHAQSSTAAWAVGFAEASPSGLRPLIARWSGSAWSLVTTPALPVDAVLDALDGTSSNNVWAVGMVGSGALVERWTGAAWTVTPIPNPPGATAASLHGIKALAANDAWAVGELAVASGSPRRRSFITHWNGSAWTQVASPSPDPTQNTLVAVDGIDDDLWAVGNIGDDYGETAAAGLVLRWNGSTWGRVTIPGADANFSVIKLRGVVALDSGDVWVVGAAFHRVLFKWVPYVLRWNGQVWQHGTIPNPPVGEFRGVTALSPTRIYAVGQKNYTQTLVARWNGSTWSQETTPSPSAYCLMTAATATGVGTIFAVGMQMAAGAAGRTLGLRTTTALP